jgi:DNA-binding NarL/FixJ family response regulator
MNPSNKQINLLIVDDHQMFIDGLKSLLRKEKNVCIIDEAQNGLDALGILKTQHIDIAIVDISMPQMSGTELIRIIKRDFPQVKTLVLTMYNDKSIIKEILNAEAEGYVLKNTGKQELLDAIYKIADNGTYYSSEVVSILMQNLNKEEVVKEKPAITLTDRELEIVRLIGQEYSSAQIAETLFISQFTVDTHRKNILKKTNTKTLVGLIKFAIENDLMAF